MRHQSTSTFMHHCLGIHISCTWPPQSVRHSSRTLLAERYTSKRIQLGLLQPLVERQHDVAVVIVRVGVDAALQAAEFVLDAVQIKRALAAERAEQWRNRHQRRQQRPVNNSETLSTFCVTYTHSHDLLFVCVQWSLAVVCMTTMSNGAISLFATQATRTCRVPEPNKTWLATTLPYSKTPWNSNKQNTANVKINENE